MKLGLGGPLIAAACVLAAGCGTAHLTSKPGTAPRSSRPADSSPAPASSQASIRLAGQQAARLLALVPVPANAVALTVAPAVPPPWTGPVVTSKVARSRVWRVPLSMSAAAAWIAAHPPVGLTSSGTGSSSGPGYDVLSYFYGPATGPGELTLQLASAGAGSDATVLRADAIVEWLSPSPERDIATGKRIRVTVSGGCPRSDAAVVGVTNAARDLRTRLLPAAPPEAGLVCMYGKTTSPSQEVMRLSGVTRLSRAQARAVAAKLAGLPLAHELGLVTSCPMDNGSADVVALSYPGRADVDVWVQVTGCGGASNGFILAGEAGSANQAGSAGGPSCSAGGWAACVRP